MYESFFGFQQRPFASAPAPEFYFPGRTMESARVALTRALERAEGAGLVVGPAGCGKSLLLQLLAEQFRDRFSVALLTNVHLTTRRSLLQAILFELGQAYRGLEEGELRLSLIDFVSPNPKCPNGLVLLVDEAHNLSIRLLEELRLMTNLVRQGGPRVRIVLAGNAELEERFANPKLASFAQRLTARCYLEAFDRAETSAYVRAQVATAGGDGEGLFGTDALESIYRATDGIPRLINQVCDHALVLAFAGGLKHLDADAIEESWADLQQLPAPWCDDAPRGVADSAGHNGVIEFGVLRDEDDEPTTLARFQPDDPADVDTAPPLTFHLADFDPTSQQTPEVELVFTPGSDPFSESFVEEEVVINPYARADELRPRLQVASEEGVVLAAQLRAVMHEQPTPRKAQPVEASPEPVVAASIPTPSLAERITIDLTQLEALTAEELTPAEDPVLPEERWLAQATEPAVAALWFGPTIEPTFALSSSDATSIVQAAAPALATPTDDGTSSESTRAGGIHEGSTHEEEPIMIVEEDRDRVASPQVNPIVRRREFRQLFAQLRDV